MADDPIQLQARVRFALGILGEENRHHEFELLCLGIARRRITSNLLPATGPVSAGGDQGRDAESHWTVVHHELPGSSEFALLASSDNVVVGCTTQQDSVSSKIKSDLVSICQQGTPVQRVVYFTSTPVTVGDRHKLIDHTRREHQVGLDIIDAVGICQYLTDPDLFYLAVQFLHLPSDLAPARAAEDNLPDWYVSVRQRWRERSERGCTLGDLVDLREPLRHSTFHDQTRADLPEWIGYARDLLAATTGTVTALRARYEIVVAVLRGLGTMRSEETLVRDFFAAVVEDPGLTDPGILEDAATLLGYVTGALVRRLTAIDPAEVRDWHTALETKLDGLISGDPFPNALAHLLALRARLALTPRPPEHLNEVADGLASIPEVVEQVKQAVRAEGKVPLPPVRPDLLDTDLAMDLLARLGRHLDAAPLFPVGPTADLFDLYTATLIDHPRHAEVSDLLDAAVERAAGRYSVGERAQARALTLLDSDRPLSALAQIHKAKEAWWDGESLEGSLIMLLLCARTYARLGLPIAAKNYALAAATAAKTASRPDLSVLIPRGIILAATYEYQAGSWLSAAHLFGIGVLAQHAYAESPYDPERYPYLWDMMGNQAIAVSTARAIRPRYLPLLDHATAASGCGPIIEQILATGGHSPPTTDRACVDAADAEGIGQPFSDAGPQRHYSWCAVGVQWEVTAHNHRLATLAAERFTAALQILLAELAAHDPLFLPGTVGIDVHTDPDLDPAQPARCRPVPSPHGDRWQVHLADADRMDERDPEHLQILAVIVTITLSQSLLTDEAFLALIDRVGRDSLLSKIFVGRPYDELADFHKAPIYQAMSEVDPPPRASVTPARHRHTTCLPARTGPGPGYDPTASRQAVQHRYDNLYPVVQYTLPRLLADSAFQATASRLKARGWRDWHLLTAIANIIGNQRARDAGHLSSTNVTNNDQKRLLDLMLRPGRHNDPQPPISLFTEENLRRHLLLAAVSTAQILGLRLRSPVTPDTLTDVLGDRYGYWADDVEHTDYFGWNDSDAALAP